MHEDGISRLEDCTEFRQTLMARPPRIVHGMAALLGVLLGAALVWAAATEADLVVRAPGAFRPVNPALSVVSTFRGDGTGDGTGVKVLSEDVHEGRWVNQGDILVNLDATALYREITRCEQASKAGAVVLTAIEGQQQVLQGEYVPGLEARKAELNRQHGDQQAKVAEAKARLESLRFQLEQAVIRAPVAGVVTRKAVQVGGVVKPGDTVAEIVNPEGFRFEAAVSGTDIGHVLEAVRGHGNVPVRIKLDPHPYQEYGALDGTVCLVAEDAEVREGQAVHVVKIDLQGDAVGRGNLRELRLGMTGQAEIVTGRQSILSLLVRKVRRTISLG